VIFVCCPSNIEFPFLEQLSVRGNWGGVVWWLRYQTTPPTIQSSKPFLRTKIKTTTHPLSRVCKVLKNMDGTLGRVDHPYQRIDGVHHNLLAGCTRST